MCNFRLLFQAHCHIRQNLKETLLQNNATATLLELSVSKCFVNIAFIIKLTKLVNNEQAINTN